MSGKMKSLRRTLVEDVVVILGVTFLVFPGIWGEKENRSPVLVALEEELGRSMEVLIQKGDPPPYFLSYQVTETSERRIQASFGALRRSSLERSRLLEVEVRVGDYALDNTHKLRDSRRVFRQNFLGVNGIPIEDDLDALKSSLWLETEKKYRQAVDELIQVKTDLAVRVVGKEKAGDFSREEPQRFIGPPSSLELDPEKWEQRLKGFSGLFKSYPDIHESSIRLTATAANKYFVNTEGAIIQSGLAHWRISVEAMTKTKDGMELSRHRGFDAHSEEGLPDEETVREGIRKIIRDLLALREAPELEPYTGPAILSGRAASVFFHEIFGHRVEGHRQKDEEEGQTFTKKINEKVLPDFLSIYDDPTLMRIGDSDLSGHYFYDDEGVKAQRVTVVEEGIMKNFLMSRSPIFGFEKSNGHGRKQPGRRAVGRQGNLIVEASRTVSESRLRDMLLEECKKQDLPFGLFFQEVEGGFTRTRRWGPQAFQVTPVMVYRVYTDGRPDELIRGADLIGTPLASFSKILGAGEKMGVFNGHCGAESGFIPVSGVAPSILTSQIEVQKKRKSSDRPPLLPPPPLEGP
jgi:predicted Zn-dependent protease